MGIAVQDIPTLLTHGLTVNRFYSLCSYGPLCALVSADFFFSPTWFSPFPTQVTLFLRLIHTSIIPDRVVVNPKIKISRNPKNM